MNELPCLRHPGNPVSDVACAGCGDFLCPACTLTWQGQARCPTCWQRGGDEAQPSGSRRALQALGASLLAPVIMVVLILGLVAIEAIQGAAVPDEHPLWLGAFILAAVVQLFGSAAGAALALEAHRLAPGSPLTWGAVAAGALSVLATLSLLATSAFG